jgi:uncharacterized membrane protein YqjE
VSNGVRILARTFLFLGAAALLTGILWLRDFAYGLAAGTFGVAFVVMGAIFALLGFYFDRKSRPEPLTAEQAARLRGSRDPLRELDQLETAMLDEEDRPPPQ